MTKQPVNKSVPQLSYPEGILAPFPTHSNTSKMLTLNDASLIHSASLTQAIIVERHGRREKKARKRRPEKRKYFYYLTHFICSITDLCNRRKIPSKCYITLFYYSNLFRRQQLDGVDGSAHSGFGWDLRCIVEMREVAPSHLLRIP